MKTCTQCHIEKDESEFSKQSRSKSGLQSRCKSCATEANRISANKNRDKNLSENSECYSSWVVKICTKCKKEKSADCFYRDPNKKGGLQGSCIECHSNSGKENYINNKDKIQDAVLLYKIKNPEKVKLSNKNYRENNKEKCNASQRLWRQANPDKSLAIIKRWNEKNPDCARIIVQNRRARKLENGGGGKLSKGLRKKLFELQRGCCAACKNKLPKLLRNQHLDHIISLAKGGTNTDDNIQLLCSKCNKRKAAKDPLKFMQEMGYLL